MSQFKDDEIVYVVENPEECQRQMDESGGTYSGNLVPRIKNPENIEFIAVPESADCVKLWDSILRDMTQSGQGVSKVLYEKTKSWKQKNGKEFIALYAKSSGNMPIFGLTSQKTPTSKVWIDLISTNSPIMPRPYTAMLQGYLKMWCEQKGVELMIPKEYRVSDDKPIVIDRDEVLEIDGDQILTTTT